MVISKIGVRIINALRRTKSAIKAVAQTSERLPVTPIETLKAKQLVLNLPKEATFHNYSEAGTAKIKAFVQNLIECINTHNLNNPTKQISYEHSYKPYIDMLLKNTANEKIAIGTLNKINTYRANICDFKTNLFKKSISSDLSQKEKLFNDLAIIKIHKPDQYQNIINSNAFKEIIDGQLSIDFIAGAKAEEIIKPDFVENALKSLREVKLPEGISFENNKQLQTYFDAVAKKEPKKWINLVENINKIKNPELRNKVLSQEFANLEYISTMAVKYPKTTEKVLKLKHHNDYTVSEYIDLFNNKKGNLKITDEMFDWYINFESKHPNATYEWTLQDINKFLNVKGTDETLVKNLLEQITSKNDPGLLHLISYDLSENNLEYLRQALAKGENLDVIQTKLRIFNNPIFKESKNPYLIDKIYKDTYEPLLAALSKIKGSDKAKYYAQNITKLKINHPEQYKQLTDSGILDLITTKKINPNILDSICLKYNTILPEILEDAKLLTQNKSLIHKFDSLNGILQKTKPGDVISVNGKMYVNNNGNLMPWQMSEEKFNELFPLVDRFVTRQSSDTCYLVSTITELYKNPHTRGAYYKMFEQVGDDIYVTIPAYKNYGGKIKFDGGNIITDTNHGYSSIAARHTQMVEQAYSRASLKIANNRTTENPLTTNNLKFLNERIRGGQMIDTYSEFIDYIPAKNKHIHRIDVDNTDINSVDNFLREYANNERYIITEAAYTSKNSGHAIIIRGYNPQTKSLLVVDPESAGVIKEIPLAKHLKDICCFDIMRVG